MKWESEPANQAYLYIPAGQSNYILAVGCGMKFVKIFYLNNRTALALIKISILVQYNKYIC